MAMASSIVSTSKITYPPMASLDSAKGPSITNRPFLPETVTPVRSSARPGLALPCAVNLSNQALFWLMSFCSSSCESVLYHSLLRYNSMYPLRSCVFISVLIGNLISLIFYRFQTYDERATQFGTNHFQAAAGSLSQSPKALPSVSWQTAK